MPRDIRLYLDDMLEAIRVIREYTAGMTYDSFAADRKTIDAVVRNLEIIGEAEKKLPEKVKDEAGEIEWRKIIGLRNLLIHEYFGVQAEVIWKTIQEDLPLLKNRLQKLIMEIH